MEGLNLTDEQRKEIARQERNKYQREYYKNNKDKIKSINKRHWEKKIKQELKNKGEM